MRKQDRDRDRVLHPKQIEDFTEKYNIGIQGVLPELQTRFEDSKFKGMTNYEDMLTYFIAFKETTIIEDNDPAKIHNVKPNPEAVFAETKSFKPKSNHSMNKSGQNSATIFEDRGEAKLVSSDFTSNHFEKIHHNLMLTISLTFKQMLFVATCDDFFLLTLQFHIII